MRLWSIHPRYLDSKGLVALWREGLLALHVLRGKTVGYTHHPQLLRFRKSAEPIFTLSAYLHVIVDEAEVKGFAFKREKLAALKVVEPLEVTVGQLQYETAHLKKKLSIRDRGRFLKYEAIEQFDPHPLFKVVDGEIESWEKVALPKNLKS
jgi:hypothetical protein